MTEANDYYLLQSKRKAITALLPYVVWLGRGGEHEMVDVTLRAVEALSISEFMWRHPSPSLRTLSSGANPRL